MKRRTLLIVAAAVSATVAGLLVYVLVDFSDPPPPQELSDLVGRQFPSVRGEDLTEAVQRLPEDLAGSPAIVLVAASKTCQRDADKWVAELRARGDVQFRETPVITSKVADLMEGFISGQMRGGLPKDMWSRVIPLFDDGERLIDFFGDYDDALTWVTVLDRSGAVRWFSAAGFDRDLAAAAVEKYRALR